MTLMGIATFVVGLLPELRLDRHCRARSCSSPAACYRAWRWAVSMAVPRPTSPSMRRRVVAASTPRGSRPRPPSVCSCRCSSILGLRLSLTPRAVRGLGLAYAVPAVDHPAGRLDLDPPAARRSRPPSQRIKAEGKGSRRRRCARPSAPGRTPRSRSSPCSAAPPAGRWFGTRASSAPCSSSPRR